MGQLVPVPDNVVVPPQNLEAEESVLGAAMLSPAALVASREILSDGREFYRESHARIWRAALALADRGEPVDAISLTDELEQRGQLDDIGGRTRLHELAALVPASANVGHYARIVAETAELREFIRAGAMLQRLGWDRPGSIEDLREQRDAILDSLTRGTTGTTLEVETWAQFERTATEHVPTIVANLWPEGGLGFIAAPPKKGKTWVGLSLALSIAIGKPFLGTFDVEKPEPVVLLALEGHRAAIRGRIGALAHGLGIDPLTDPVLRDNLHIIYKPAGINLADPAWVRTVRELVQRVGARLLVVDVLRAAAVMKENSNDEFGALVRALQPLQQDGCAVALLHHFGKLTELSKERAPAERMSGAGAMYGAIDVGVFITKSDDGARTLRVEFAERDLVTPDPIGVHLDGDMTGSAGGFVFSDAAAWQVLEAAPDAETLRAPAHEIAAYVIEHGGDVERREVEGFFEISADTLTHRLYKLRHEHQVELVVGRGRGTKSRLVHHPATPDDDQLALPEESNDFSYDSVSYDSSLSEGRDFTPTKTLDSALVHESHESPDPDNLAQTESADLQGEKGHDSYASPTERQTPADAEPATPEAHHLHPVADPDDIDWSQP